MGLASLSCRNTIAGYMVKLAVPVCAARVFLPTVPLWMLTISLYDIPAGISSGQKGAEGSLMVYENETPSKERLKRENCSKIRAKYSPYNIQLMHNICKIKLLSLSEKIKIKLKIVLGIKIQSNLFHHLWIQQQALSFL